MTTVASLTLELAKWEAARDAILDGAQSYSINGRSLTRASLDYIDKKCETLQSRIDMFSSTGSSRVRVPLFPSSRNN